MNRLTFRVALACLAGLASSAHGEAVEADVPNAREAWDIVRSLAKPEAIYGYEMMPRGAE